MKATISVVALGCIISCAQAFAQNAPPAGGSPFQRGLAEQMRNAAKELKNGERYEAMSALNGARHLSKATRSATSLEPNAVDAFQQAEKALNAARREIQNGSPEQATETLLNAANALDKVNLPATPGPDQASLAKASGRTALNAKGRRIGSVREITAADNGGFHVRITSGGLLGIGATERVLRADSLLVSKRYVAIAGKRRNDGE